MMALGQFLPVYATLTSVMMIQISLNSQQVQTLAGTKHNRNQQGNQQQPEGQTPLPREP